MPPHLAVSHLSVAFAQRDGGVQALHEVAFAQEKGRILGILGPNGSGKTTLLRVLAGLQRATSGQAEIGGEPCDSRALRRRVAFQPEGPLPLDVLSAPELLAYVGAQLGLRNRDADAAAQHWLTRLDLLHAGRRRVRTFSTGMQKRLALAMALLGDPEVLLLDEPTSGLDPFGSETVTTILRERAAAGTTILLASHHLLEVEDCCDDLLILLQGKVAACGPRDQLLATGETALLLRGLDAAGRAALSASAHALGATSARFEPARGGLFALLKRLAPEQRQP